ncbi:MAG TPA: hypothetical protein VFQ36_19700 [Ktedonobacteraceae bacterium]|nr:hypothetical protein [Ktedonobacteraceae bacterium]
MQKQLVRWGRGLSLLGIALLVVGMLSAFTMHASSGAHAASAGNANASANKSFTFNLVASPGISACLPHARGSVTITPNSVNDVMKVTVSGMPAHTDFDLFVIQLPNKPFGVSWYQSDLHTDANGTGGITVQGIFNVETFSVSPGGPTTTFAPTHQYHLGLWFNDPNVPFNLGCEPGQTSPVVTPFNGEQHAGIQVLNTSNFPDNAGPLSHVS